MPLSSGWTGRQRLRRKTMSALTIDGDFCPEKLVVAVAAEPAKEKTMEKTATLPVADTGTPFADRLRALGGAVLPPLLGLLILLGVWYVATLKGGSIPGPGTTWDAAVVLFADPFYQNGPNDQGIGWNVLSSLQ